MIDDEYHAYLIDYFSKHKHGKPMTRDEFERSDENAEN